MTKWEYIYAEAGENTILYVNGHSILESQGFLKGSKGQAVSEFLTKSGQDGWEVVGICQSNEQASRWRLVLKRPMV